MPLLSYLFLAFVFFHTPNLKRSFNLFWRQVLGLEGQVIANNTDCLPDIPVATHHNQFLSEPPATTHNWLFSEPPMFERMQQTFGQMKNFRNSQVSVVIFFYVGWASGLQIVFWWDNVTNQNYVWIILLKMTFYFPRYSGYIWQARWTIWRFSCQIF